MRAFTERSPLAIGIVVVAIIAAATAGALGLNSGVFEHPYTVTARFTDTAGLRAGDDVRVAGVVAGHVSSVRQHEDQVDVRLAVDEGVELPVDTRAEIVVETLLGSKHVRLVAGDDWSRPLRAGDLIRDTRTPTEVLDIEDTGAPLLEETDAEAIDDLLGKLERITEGQAGNVGEIVTGLNRLLGAVQHRQEEARRLIGSSRTVSETLADRDEDLLATVDDLDVVLDGLVQRRAQLVALLESTESAARETADLVAENRPEIDAVLDEVHQDLQVLDRHQGDLAQSLSTMSNAISGFASVGYSGPGAVPNEWANMYTQLIGPIGPDALFGSCGLLDDAFDVLLGPDPVADCQARTGPLPTATPAGTPGAPAPAVDPLTAMYGDLVGSAG